MNKLKFILLLLCLALTIISCTNHKDKITSKSIPSLRVPENLDYLKLKMENHYPIPKIANDADKGANFDKDELVQPPK